MKKNNFPVVMKTTAAVTALVTAALSAAYYFFPQDWIRSCAITTGTTFYHFAMRLLVGAIVPQCVRNPMKYRWFQQKAFEPQLYAKLRVKHWKDRMPTYDPSSFSLRDNSLKQIVHNSCVSESVHEVIVLLSFVPVLFTLWWDSLFVFAVTSILAALFDSIFVIMQRYNRPRLMRILNKEAHAQ